MPANLHKRLSALKGREALVLEGFFSIMDKWGVDAKTARKILGMPPERTFYEWKRGNVAGIWKALEILYSNPEHADTWVKRPNKSLGGQTPLQRMAAGDVTDLAAVRAYADAARAPWS